MQNNKKIIFKNKIMEKLSDKKFYGAIIFILSYFVIRILISIIYKL